VTIFYFTSTGNCLDVAKHIGGELLSIPQLMRENRFEFEDDAVGLVCPVYFAGLPKMVTQFLKRASWKADYSFAIVTYGWNPWATLYYLQKSAEKCGRQFDYLNLVSTVDNYLPHFEMANELAELPLKNVKLQIQDIATDISNRKANTASAGLAERVKWHFAQATAVIAMHGDSAKKYIVNENCTRCGICAKVCPAKNITVAETVTFGSSCEVCLGCVHLCPQNALHIKHERSSVRYRNADVSLKEIIEANCQQK
jgi:MinD superfamily P-loop ATPase containing an inserted ferredoxin domain